MSIQNDEQLKQSLRALTTLQLAVASQRRELEGQPSLHALMAEGALDEIARIQSEVNAYIGIDDARAKLWLRVVGDQIDASNAPTGVVTSLLDSLRKGLQAATEQAYSGTLSARPTALVQQAVDVRLAAIAEGSLRIGLNIEHGEDAALAEACERSLDDYLAVAAWASTSATSDESADKQLSERIPDPARRRLLLNLVMQLAPRTRGTVESVEFSGRAVKTSGQVLLTRQARNRLANAVDRVERTVREGHEGLLRELDLDKQTGVVRNEKEVPCEFAEELMTQAQEALGRLVRVVGSRAEATGRRRTTLFVTRIEIIDDVSDDETT